jgi:UDPglucose 6-dehydrogenase
MTKIAVVGLGYVGITTAVGMAQLGHDVIGFDIDEIRVETLLAGEAPILEVGLEEALSSLLKTGRLQFTDDLKEVATAAPEFFFVCVPTPQDESGSANLTHVLSASRDIAAIAEPSSVVVLKSTVPVGSGERVRRALSRTDLHVASNPEFLREGTALQDFMNPDRIVVGSSAPEVSRRVLDLYGSLDSKKISTSAESAELVKYSSNAYLAMRLSFVNDLAALCEKVGANVEDVVRGLGSDTRIGPSFLSPGPGWGGSCFPKDTRALMSVAAEYGLELPLVDATLESNDASFTRVVESIRELVGGELEGAIVAVWGLAFKANTDDTRDSPSINIINRLLDRGSKVQAFDPAASAPTREGLVQFGTAEDSAIGADVLVVLTEWTQFAQVDPRVISKTMRKQAVLDTRRVLPAGDWKSVFSDFKVLGG